MKTAAQSLRNALGTHSNRSTDPGRLLFVGAMGVVLGFMLSLVYVFA